MNYTISKVSRLPPCKDVDIECKGCVFKVRKEGKVIYINNKIGELMYIAESAKDAREYIEAYADYTD